MAASISGLRKLFFLFSLRVPCANVGAFIIRIGFRGFLICYNSLVSSFWCVLVEVSSVGLLNPEKAENLIQVLGFGA